MHFGWACLVTHRVCEQCLSTACCSSVSLLIGCLEVPRETNHQNVYLHLSSHPHLQYISHTLLRTLV